MSTAIVILICAYKLHDGTFEAVQLVVAVAVVALVSSIAHAVDETASAPPVGCTNRRVTASFVAFVPEKVERGKHSSHTMYAQYEYGSDAIVLRVYDNYAPLSVTLYKNDPATCQR